MTRSRGVTRSVAALAACCAFGCSQKLVVSDSQRVALSCDDGRPTKLVVESREDGKQGAFVDPAGGYLLFDGGHPDSKLTRIDADGNTLEVLSLASKLGPIVYDAVPTADGGALLGGSSAALSGDQAWIGRVDSGWHLLWERAIQGGRGQVAQLADGGAILGGIAANATKPPSTVFLARFGAQGDLLWQRDIAVPGLQYGNDWWGRTLSVSTDNRIRFVASTDQGIDLIESSLDGVTTQRVLDTTLTLHINDIAALPDGRLLLASTRSPNAVLTMVAADGSVQWEKVYGDGQYAVGDAVAYNAARHEILLGGRYGGANDGDGERTWIVATDLEGNQTWRLVRLPIHTNIDGDVSSASADRGPPITDIAPRPDGSFIATGSSSNLSFFLVGADSCTH